MGIFSATGKILGASFAAGDAIDRKTNNFMDNMRVARAQKALKSSREALQSGYLYPGDHAGIDSSGLMDYRGLEIPEYIAPAIADGHVPIGTIRNPRTGFTQKAFLPWEVLNTHVAIVAPPGSGKTYGLVVPWILSFIEQGGRVIANDVKGDLLQDIIAAKKKMGASSFKMKVTRFNPMDRTSSKRWNPLDEVSDDISRVQLVEAVLGSIDEYQGNDRFFIERDHRWLKGLIKFGKATLPDVTFNDIYKLICSYDDVQAVVAAHPSLCSDFRDMANYSPDDFSMAVSSLQNKLEWFTYDDARYVTGKSDFDLETITETPGLLLIGSNLSDGEPAKAATAMMFAMLKSVYAERRSASGHLPNAWIIDEAAVVAKRISLDMTLSQVRSYGVGITMALQDVTQLGKTENEQQTFLSNCKTFITLRDVSSETAKYLSKRMGEHTVQKISASLDARGRQVPQTVTEKVPLLAESEIMHPPAEFGRYTAIVHTPTLGTFCTPPGATNNPYIVDLAR